MKTIPICVVGGGPVGMNMALNLDALGVPSMLINIDPETLHRPRGNGQNAHTMEHYRRLGLASGLRKLGLPPEFPTDAVYFTRVNGWELARIPMPSEKEKMAAVANAATTDQIVEPMFRCNQMYVERHLLDHLKTRRGIELRYGWRCFGWTEEPDGLAVEIEEQTSGRRETVKCAYLVGCDGGQSFVRRKLGIHYSDSGEAVTTKLTFYSGKMVSTHIRAPALFEKFAHRLGWHNLSVHRSFLGNMINLNGKDEVTLSSHLQDPDMRPDDRLIGRHFIEAVGEGIDFELIGHWPWTPGRALVADSFGWGRVVLAGDSMHLFTPTGGFGMNTGVDDAANLGWKLAALVQGWGGAKLLATYEIERRPIAIRNTGLARFFTQGLGSLQIPPNIEEDSAEGAAARAEVGRTCLTFAEEYASIGIQLGARYDGSPIVVPDGTSPPPDDPFTYRPSACPGGRAPHAWLCDRSSLFDHLGPGFTLLTLRHSESELAAATAATARRGIPLTCLSVSEPEIRDLYGADMALIRPDQHIAWRGNALPDNIDGLFARITGY